VSEKEDQIYLLLQPNKKFKRGTMDDLHKAWRRDKRALHNPIYKVPADLDCSQWLDDPTTNLSKDIHFVDLVEISKMVGGFKRKDRLKRVKRLTGIGI
jgi:hypothetical protein